MEIIRKFLVINHSEHGDRWETVCSSAEDANRIAERDWRELSASEKKHRHIYVGWVENTPAYLDEEAWDYAEDGGEPDYTMFHSIETEDDFFDSDVEKLGNPVRRERKLLGMTQKELAERAGMNLRQIQKIESGEILLENLTLKNAVALADALLLDDVARLLEA